MVSDEFFYCFSDSKIMENMIKYINKNFGNKWGISVSKKNDDFF